MILRLKDESCDVIRVLKWTSGSSDAHSAPRITNAFATSGECKWILHSSSPWKNTIYSRIGASVGGVEERESAINYFNNPRG